MKINIQHVAKLANLPLIPHESSTYEKQLEDILKYVEQLESVDTKDIDTTFNVSMNKNITRKDTVNKNLTQEEAIKNADVKKDGYVVTKGVFTDE